MSLVGLHVKRQARTARRSFIEIRSYAEARVRARQIALLPKVAWKDVQLYTIRCRGASGKGPHAVNVPEGLLWALINIRDFRCPYHIGD